MRAFVLNRYGDASGTALQDLPTPIPAPTELLIRVQAAGLNPVDFKFRQGKLRPIMRPQLPLVMGSELSGTVEATGERVARFKVGDRVFVRVDKHRMGAFAEFACVDASLVALAPSSLDLTTAAGIPLAGLTALQCLRDELAVGPASRILIPGGAGGVGTFAIQIAKHLGATVTTTASSRGEALVRSLGADEVVDYTSERFEDVLGGLDGVFDLIGEDTLERAFPVVKRGGAVVSISGPPEPETALKDLKAGPFLALLFWLASLRVRAVARRYGVRYRYVFMHPSGPDLETLAALIDSGQLKVVVDRVFPFEQIAEAMDYLETGRAKGKVIVRMGPASA